MKPAAAALRRAWGSTAKATLAPLAALSVFYACGGQQIDTTVCTPGETLCGSSCAALDKDPQNCGACGAACAGGEVCSGGYCASACADGQAQCVVDGGSSYCASVGTDNANCGACGHACGLEEFCAAGECQSACASDQTLCEPDDASAYCTALATDVDNCGACGVTCTAHAYCAGGACSCEAMFTMCGGQCSNVLSDAANCGACGSTCGGTCDNGHCVVQLANSSTVGPLAIDSSNVYWIDSGLVRQISKAGGSAVVLSTTASGASAVATDGNYVYWGGPIYDGVSLCAVGGGAITTVAKGMNAISIATGSGIYFTTISSVAWFPSGGGTVNTFTSSEDGPTGLATAGGVLYWSTGAQEIRKMPTFNPTPWTIASTSFVGSMATDGVNVYFSPNEELRAVSIDGGAQTILASGLQNNRRITTDGANVYWVDPAGVWRMPVGGGPVTYLCALGGFEYGYIAVDATSVYWTNNVAVEKATPK